MQTACTYCMWEMGLMRLQTATMMLLWSPTSPPPPKIFSLPVLSENLLPMSHMEGVSSDLVFTLILFMVGLEHILAFI